MAWGDILKGFGGQQGLLFAGANMLSSQRGEEGAALSRGIAQGQQMQQQAARQRYLDSREARETAQFQAEQQATARAQAERDRLAQFFRGGDGAASASSVAGVGATPQQSVFDPSALNAAQTVAGGGPRGGNSDLPPELSEYLGALPPEQAQEVYSKFLADRRDAMQSMDLARFNQGAMDARQIRSFGNQRALEQMRFGNERSLAGYRAQLSAQSRAPSALAQKTQALIDAGVNPQRARLIAAGAIKDNRDPVTGEVGIVNLAEDPQPTQQEFNPADLANNDTYTAGDVSSTFGTGGALKNIANTVTEAFTGSPYYEDQSDAEATVNSLNNDLMQTLASGFAGRPSNFTLEGIKAQLPSANSFTTGPETSRKRYAQQLENLDQVYDIANGIATGSSGRYTPKQQSEAREKMQQIELMRRRLGSVVGNFGNDTRPSYASGRDQGALVLPEGRDDPGTPPEGIDAADWGYMTPEERALFQ